MKLSDVFESDFLTAEDLGESDMPVTITAYKVDKFDQNGKQESKPILQFAEIKKALVCNRTNAGTIAKIYGSDLDDWIGKRITLFLTEVEYRGDMVMAIRVRLKPPAASTPQPPAADAKRVAWAAWKSRNPDIADDADALASRLQAIVNDIYPGITLGKLTPKQWSELERSGFNHPVTPAGTGIHEADIPF